MLKQGRAFGVGQILVTQNPVDLDYKGLSNAGTWFIGKLQTDNDKERLLDGLQGASSGMLDRRIYDAIIAGLGKREFLLHNVHEDGPQTFRTRWVMNYLAGPLTRSQIPALNLLAGAKQMAPTADPAGGDDSQPLDAFQPIAMLPDLDRELPELTERGTRTRPAIPEGVAEYFLPYNLTMVEAFRAAGRLVPEEGLGLGILYKPVLLVQADIRYFQRKYELDHAEKRAALVPDPDPRGMVRWEEYPVRPIDPASLERTAVPGARFAVIDASFSNARRLKSFESDFVDFLFRRASVTVLANEPLDLFAGPGTTEGNFRKMVSVEARKMLAEEMEETKAGFKKKFDALQKKLNREKRELEEDRTEHSQRKMEELSTHFENLFGGKSYRRRRISSSLSKRRMTQRAKADIDESLDVIEELEREMDLLAEEMEEAIDALKDKWGEAARQITEIPVSPYKKDILVEIFGVAWMPYHMIQVDQDLVELPGYAGTLS
jgi:hypothetical protein